MITLLQTPEALYTPPPSPSQPSPNDIYTHEDYTQTALDFTSGGKDAFVVEVGRIKFNLLSSINIVQS